MSVSFQLKISYIILGGGGGCIASLIGCAVTSYQLGMLSLVVNGTKDKIIGITQ